MNLTIQEIVNAVGGRLLNPPTNEKKQPAITRVSTDTRKISAGALFVPIAGERFDGHNYIRAAAESGAVCAFTEKEHPPHDAENSGILLVLVSSTRRALMDLAGYYRLRHNIKVVAITGSAGKTTTKEMIAHVLAQKYKTKKTLGNFNNDIGLPLSIFQLEPGDEVLVLEMGMNHAGEIHELSLVGAPDIAVITHIGDAHIENFENREGILHAKLEITDGLKSDGTVILNGDDPLLTGPIATEKVKPFKVLYPAGKNILEAELVGLQESRCHFNWQGQDIKITVPLPGAHMVMNAFLAVAVGMELGCSPGEIAKGFADFTPPGGRLSVETANDMVIINDVYNANPASMKEAIKVLCNNDKASAAAVGLKVAILGDMSELGHVAKERHEEVGAFAATAGIDTLITIGALAKHMHEGFYSVSEENRKPDSSAEHFRTSEEFLAVRGTFLKPGDTVLVKASRSMAFENITNVLLRSE